MKLITRRLKRSIILEIAIRYPEESYPGAGTFNIAENHSLVGFKLTVENQIIHDILFSK
jgi:hypothetical protein